MAKRSKGKGDKKPIRKKLTTPQKREREYNTAYDAAAKNFYKLFSLGFRDTSGKFMTEYGEFRPKAKNINKSTLATIKKYSYAYMAEHMKYEEEPGKYVSGKRGLEIVRSTSAKKAVETRKSNAEWKSELPPYSHEPEPQLDYEPEEPEQYIPVNLDIYDQIVSIIYDSLPEGKWIGKGKYHDYYPDKRFLENALWDEVDKINNIDNLNDANIAEVAYTQYLESHKSDIERAVKDIELPSDEVQIQDAVLYAYIIVTNNPHPDIDISKRLEV